MSASTEVDLSPTEIWLSFGKLMQIVSTGADAGWSLMILNLCRPWVPALRWACLLLRSDYLWVNLCRLWVPVSMSHSEIWLSFVNLCSRCVPVLMLVSCWDLIIFCKFMQEVSTSADAVWTLMILNLCRAWVSALSPAEIWLSFGKFMQEVSASDDAGWSLMILTFCRLWVPALRWTYLMLRSDYLLWIYAECECQC